jgi:hypothetical protein
VITQLDSTNMAIQKSLSIIFVFKLLAITTYLHFLGVHGNQLYMETLTTKPINHANKIGMNDNPLNLKLFDENDRYYLRILIGTPPQEVLMVLDTGGGDPWIPCSSHQFSSQKFDRFHPSASSSYQRILCDSQLCKPYAPSSLTCNLIHPIPCNFSELYADGEEPTGVLSQDTFGFSTDNMQISNIMFGCVHEGNVPYQLDNGWVYGNIGLLPRPESFLGQMASQYGHYPIMSYYLSSRSYDVSATSWIFFGGQSSQNLSFVPLVGQGYFSINLRGITVDNVDVDFSNITTLVYDPITQVGGFVLDTGSKGTWLQEPLHSRFVNTFVAAMKTRTGIYPNPKYNDVSNDNEVCYAFDSDVNIFDIQVPNVTFHLDNDVHLHLGFQNLFILSREYFSEDNQQIWCLAFNNFADENIYGHIIGNIFQQNFHVEIDFTNGRIGFGRLNIKL